MAFYETHDPDLLKDMSVVESYLEQVMKTGSILSLSSGLIAKYGADLTGKHSALETETLSPRDPRSSNLMFGATGDHTGEMLSEMASRHGAKDLKHEEESKVILTNKQGVCSKFRLDLESDTFGMCK